MIDFKAEGSIFVCLTQSFTHQIEKALVFHLLYLCKEAADGISNYYARYSAILQIWCLIKTFQDIKVLVVKKTYSIYLSIDLSKVYSCVGLKPTSGKISGLWKMSLENRKCSKCFTTPENTQHLTHSCRKLWPFWKDQVCEICFKSGHSCSLCIKKNDNQHNIYNICGHLYLPKFCPFRSTSDPKQHTKEKYEIFMNQATPNNQPHTIPSTSSASPSKIVTSTLSSVPQVQSHPTQAQPMASGVKQVTDFIPSAKTEKEVEGESRASGFQQLVHRRATTVTVEDRNIPDPVQANYFKVTFDSMLIFKDTRLNSIKSIQKTLSSVSFDVLWSKSYSKRTLFQGCGFRTTPNTLSPSASFTKPSLMY